MASQELHHKRGNAIEDSAKIDEVLTDGEVLEAYSASSGPGEQEQLVRDHVLVSHPALRDGVSLFVPATDCSTVGDIVEASQTILRRTGDNRLCVSELKTLKDDKALDPRAKWRNVIESGSVLIATHGDGPTMASSTIPKDVTVWKVRHRLDSSVWCASSNPSSNSSSPSRS